MARTLTLVGVVVLGACARPEPPLTSARQGIFGGAPAPNDDSVFFIDTDAGVCSATLIAPRTLLTAAHCVDAVPMFASNPSRVGAADAGLFVVVKRRTYFDATDGGVADLALLLLDRAPLATPRPWRWWGPAPVENEVMHLVGFGRSELEGPGERRSVETRVRGAVEHRAWGLVVVTGDFGAGLCFGDSGGATLAGTDAGLRLVAVNSFITAECGAGASSSVLLYPYRRFIESWLAEHEDPTCARDGRCVAGCAPEDPDCRCGADGVCRAECPELDDPDCPGACRIDGVCSPRGVCPSGDGDCIAEGMPCASAGQCADRLCISDPQNPARYCSAPCTAATCPLGMSCDTARAMCIVAPLPVVAEGEACGPSVKCATGSACTEHSGKTVCLRVCTSQAQCLAGARCRFGSVSVCIPTVVSLDAGASWEGPLAPVGCAAAPGRWLVASVLVLVARRRRRARSANVAN